MSNLIKELRSYHYEGEGDEIAELVNTMYEAADEIERLQKRIKFIYTSSNGDLYAEIERLNCALTISRGKHENAIRHLDRLQEVVDAAKGVTEYGEVAFMGVNIPFKSFRKLKEVLSALEDE